MKKYDTPEIELTMFSSEAILLTSGVDEMQDEFDGLTYSDVFGS